MKRKMNQQLTIFDYQPLPVLPDFAGDFEKEMDYFSKLPEEDWKKIFRVKGVKK